MSYQPQTLRELEELIELYWHDVRDDGHNVGVYRNDEGWFARYPSGHESRTLDSHRKALWALVEGTSDDEEAFRRIVGEEAMEHMLRELKAEA